jgi:hypothetical protein
MVEGRRRLLVNALSAALGMSFAKSASAAATNVPDKQELSKLTLGLSRIDYLLNNWDMITSSCDETEEQQGMRILSDKKCKSPLKVQRYIGTASTLDPLFNAGKLMRRAEPLVSEDNLDDFFDGVNAYEAQQQMTSTMAYTSEWSGYENPNGSGAAIADALLDAKGEVVKLRNVLSKMTDLLGLPPPKPFDPDNL